MENITRDTVSSGAVPAINAVAEPDIVQKQHASPGCLPCCGCFVCCCLCMAPASMHSCACQLRLHTPPIQEELNFSPMWETDHLAENAVKYKLWP